MISFLVYLVGFCALDYVVYGKLSRFDVALNLIFALAASYFIS